MLSAWQADLDRFVAELKIRKPSLVVKRGRFAPVWLPSAWGSKPAAWAWFNTIVVADGALRHPAEVRRYLLAHELGHVAKGHSQRQAIALSLVLLCSVPGVFGILPATHLPLLVKILWAGVFFGAALYFSWLTLTCLPEYEADAVAARLIGQGQVIYGILEMARLSGEGLTSKRRNRLRKLGVPPSTQ